MDNKRNKGFNTTDIQTELLLLHGEMNELFRAFRRHDHDNIAEELADVTIYLLGLAEMAEVDLASALLKKMDVNERRIYHADGTKEER